MPPPSLKPPAPTKPAGKPVMSKPKTSAAPARTKKTFSVQAWAGADEGRKMILYGLSGVGKTTLSATAPNPIHVGFDDGGRKIHNPITGQPLQAIAGIETFEDFRDALHQDNLWERGTTAVIDNGTKLEAIIEPYLYATCSMNGKKATKMRDFGWDGPSFMLDAWRLVMSDLDGLVRRGVNVLLLAQMGQVTVANAEGVDYLQDGPRLVHNKQYSVRNEVIEWADDVLRVGYQDFAVVKDDAKAKAGKVVSADATRAIYTGGAQHFIAKSRPVNGYRIPTTIGFENEGDRSLWQFIFEGAKAEE